MTDVFEAAKQESDREHALDALRKAVEKDGRIKLSYVSKWLIRDSDMRSWAIGKLLTDGVIRVDRERTKGRIATVLVLVD